MPADLFRRKVRDAIRCSSGRKVVFRCRTRFRKRPDAGKTVSGLSVYCALLQNLFKLNSGFIFGKFVLYVTDTDDII